ncbi:hypothetical protein [Apibacter sp. HY039]|uniref:hypothetical protein n=1 Tax=Apibacter sp. HY039 TaxID=2501476 RepID=UPI000FEBC6AE|nr:hypothetical protein [Apibacter sp. HY039]
MSELIALKAQQLAADSILMKSYEEFYNEKGFFSLKTLILPELKEDLQNFQLTLKVFLKNGQSLNGL